MYLRYFNYIYIFVIILMMKYSNCMTNKLILIRHGESMWNYANLFTGWANVGLTPKGVQESINAGNILRNHNITPKIAFTSKLKRSVDTNKILLNEMNLEDIDTHTSWRLNERHYGKLTGYNRETNLWKGGYFDVPPNIQPIQNLNIYNEVAYNPEYGESYYMTFLRVMPIWNIIKMHVENSNTPIVCSHKNCLKVIIQHLENTDINNIRNQDIPNALPIIYDFDNDFNIVNKEVKHI